MSAIYSAVLQTPWITSPSDGHPSETLTAQWEAEEAVSQLLASYVAGAEPEDKPYMLPDDDGDEVTKGKTDDGDKEDEAAYKTPVLLREQHITYIQRFLSHPLPSGFVALDASRPWLLYWSLHSLALLGHKLPRTELQRVVDTLRSCQNPDGGFGGGPGQRSHVAASYAAVGALAYTGEDGWKMINREGMYNFLLSVKQPDGSFIMHIGGEVDVRGSYCALSVASLLNILTPTLAANSAQFIATCQTYEGGLASASHPFFLSSAAASAPPLGEAHGGYTFCAAASYFLLLPFERKDAGKELDVKRLLRWAVQMQANPIEGGGFRGRSNKLVDGCYSWWNGGLFPLIRAMLSSQNQSDPGPICDTVAWQTYVLIPAQSTTGGLRDKPGKYPDAYHTCYNLSGLSSAQHGMVFSSELVEIEEEGWVEEPAKIVAADEAEEVGSIRGDGESEQEASERRKRLYARFLSWEETPDEVVLGKEVGNLVAATHPIFNVEMGTTRRMLAFFYEQPAGLADLGL